MQWTRSTGMIRVVQVHQLMDCRQILRALPSAFHSKNLSAYYRLDMAKWVHLNCTSVMRAEITQEIAQH